MDFLCLIYISIFKYVYIKVCTSIYMYVCMCLNDFRVSADQSRNLLGSLCCVFLSFSPTLPLSLYVLLYILTDNFLSFSLYIQYWRRLNNSAWKLRNAHLILFCTLELLRKTCMSCSAFRAKALLIEWREILIYFMYWNLADKKAFVY